MKLKINIIDAFTDTQFKGNSAGVILLTEWLPAELMQAIATENNLSETAFLVKQADDNYHIRWFSPIKEIDFCGHATLASAFQLFSEQPTATNIGFKADAVGQFNVEKKPDDLIQMRFPIRKPELVKDPPIALTAGLSITPIKVLRNQQAYFAIYANETDVYNVCQHQEQLKKLAPLDVVVTAPATEYDFVSRYFWPASGGDEDPVTGSIHTGLAPYWAEVLGKATLRAYQASTRGGMILCEVTNSEVSLSGHCVRYLSGSIHIQ